jgi:hypothetical protein
MGKKRIPGDSNKGYERAEKEKDAISQDTCAEAKTI